jgi:transcriptional regulator with XRE-family HTH domain
VRTADLELDTSAVYEAISRERRQRGMSREAVMKEVGTVSSTLTRLGLGHAPKAETLLRICAWITNAPG